MGGTLLDKIGLILHGTYSGVDFTLEGNGGLDCFLALSQWQRLKETLIYSVFVLFVLIPLIWKTFSIPKEVGRLIEFSKNRKHVNCALRKLLLIALSVVLGVELSYKLTTRSLIYLLNPCHVITIIQIYLLATEPSVTSLNVFRCHLHYLFSPFLAIAFPATNTRFLPGEVLIYWVQHILIFFIVPPYLIAKGGVYQPEPLRDFRWVWLSAPMFGFWMYGVLQFFAIFTLVNLNNTLCAAVSDPFKGPNYRWYAGIYLTFLNLTLGKVYTAVVNLFLAIYNVLLGRKPEANNNKIFLDEKEKTN